MLIRSYFYVSADMIKAEEENGYALHIITLI